MSAFAHHLGLAVAVWALVAAGLRVAPGAGLAANQIGVALRVCVVKGDENQIWGLVNPVIVKAEGSQVGYEGCLSKPGWVGEVERHEAVVVKGLNRHGKEVRIKSTGFTARAFQHELDHLDGVLFTDRMNPTARTDIAYDLHEFETAFESRRATGGILSDEQIAAQLAELERKYT